MTRADLPAKTPRWGRMRRVAAYSGGLLFALLVLAYLIVLIVPVPVPFVRDHAQNMLREAMSETMDVDLGEARLALENGLWPVVRFSPVQLTDSATGADISMDALDVGVSPFKALIGQPAASVTLLAPNLQIVQDFYGPRMSGFDIVEPTDGSEPFVRVREGETSLPSVRVSPLGIEVDEDAPEGAGPQFRSDNYWMIANLQAASDALAGFREQTDAGLFSRLRILDATIHMHDSVYGLLRKLEAVNFELEPSAIDAAVQGQFSADLAGRTIRGNVKRDVQDNGDILFSSKISDLDFASLLAFLDDADSVIAVRGAGDFELEVVFDKDDNSISSGFFDIDLTGAQLRIQDDLFPVVTRDFRINWDPQSARYAIDNAFVQLGKSYATMSGVFLMGLDESFGPTLTMALTGRDVHLQPNDLPAPDAPFEEISFSGWSAPLYGAMGIDKLVAVRPGVVVSVAGRADFLRAGIGFDVTLGGSGASADDFKRLWPYFLVSGARDWFVSNVRQGQVVSSDMRFNFPVGSISDDDEDKPVPEGAITIDLAATDISFTPLVTMDAVDVNGLAGIQVRDNVTTVGIEGGVVETSAGPVEVNQGALIIDTGGTDYNVFELSGDVLSSVPSLVSLAREHFPDTLVGVEENINVNALEGSVAGAIVATMTVGRADDQLRDIDYAANGAVASFASTEPIEGYTVDNGQLTFAVSPEGYTFNGDAKFNGFDAGINVSGVLDEDPNVLVSADLSVEQISELGIDLTSFLGGSVRFAARPLASGELQIAADLENTSVNFADLGITKQAGVPGDLNLSVHSEQDGEMLVENVALAFANVDVRGDLLVRPDTGIETANLSTFKLSDGDDANLNIVRTENGIDLMLRGQQLDLKPMLQRFFGLDQVSTGGPQSTQFGNAINLDVELNRAIGFYSTTAFNFDLELALVGEDLRRVSLQAQFAEGSNISIATNPLAGGRTMSVAFNDLGTVLRYLNVYPRLLGGQGSMTLTRDTNQDLDRGQMRLRDFALVDEAKVAEILGNHSDSRSLITESNRISFNVGDVKFIRRSDRIEVEQAVLDGDTTGGTMRGFIYTKARQYDLTGTYIPLFALNNIFQKLPIIGELLGGRDGEGLVGVTFAVRGDLDAPQFIVNPASILLPGVLRGIMEFRANEAPREINSETSQ